MSKKTKTPPAPNYTALAEQEAASNLKANQVATSANRVNQTNPFASLTWSQGIGADGNPNWSQNVSLNGQDQSALNTLRGTTGTLANRSNDVLSQDFTLDGAPEMGDADFGAVQEIQDAMMSRMAPDLLRQRQRQEAQLVAQGVGGNTNSASWDRAQEHLGRNENDASMQALLAGAKEYGNIYDRKQGSRNQWIAEQEGLRDKPLQELLSMLRAQDSYKAPQFEQFYTQEGAGGTKYGSAGQQQYGAAMDAANAKAANKSQTASTVGSIASVALAFL